VSPAARRLSLGTAALCAALACALAAESPQGSDAASGDAPPAAEQSEIAPLATKALLLDVAYAGTRIVLVGERGQVLLSDDQAKTWRQAPAPTLSSLTAVYFVDAQHGWAVGHDEVILRTDDGGEHWTRSHFKPEAQQPLLDVWFADADHGIAVGAYSAYYVSTDGGRTWTARAFAPAVPTAKNAKSAKPTKPVAPADDLGEDEEAVQYHLNGIAAGAPARLYLAAEAGHLYRSDDGGATWTTLASPYEGSYFGTLPLDGDAVLAFGMRGHLFRSENAGADWTEVPTDTLAMLTSAVRLPNGGVAITGLAGVLLVSTDGGHTFKVEQQADRKGMSSAVLVGDQLLTVGEGGAILRPLAPQGRGLTPLGSDPSKPKAGT
jgi:photosystem II stability/assembly factor-like uncharacterized protein